MADENKQPSAKRPRSFSLLTFLLLSGVVALSIAIYSANKEVAETRAKMAKRSEEMGYIEDADDTKLHVRRLGGYPRMSFAFRYQLPKDKRYKLHIGSGAIDYETDLPNRVLYEKPLNLEATEGMFVVSLVEMPTNLGVKWLVEVVEGNSLKRVYCRPNEFDWLQTYLAAFPTDQLVHGSVRSLDPDQPAVLYSKSEFHPSAIDSLTPELLKNRKMFKIWLEPVEPDKSGTGFQSVNTQWNGQTQE